MNRATPKWTLFTDPLVVALASLVGLIAGLMPLKDNSAFTHLATGMQMVARGWIPAIPRVDPYSFTAPGEPWVVQSWLPAYAVGVADRLFGTQAVVVLAGLTAALLAGLVALLARTGRIRVTAGATAIALVVGLKSWAPRPLMVGLVLLALTALIVDRPRRTPWLIPIGWVWVQCHGSFPLGVAYLIAVAIGTWLDEGRDLAAVKGHLRAIAALVAGILLGGINPLGPKLIVFPLNAISKREVFAHISEWKPLNIATDAGALAAIGLAIALFVCVRCRPPWRVWLPLVLFAGLAISAQRNVAPLGVVVAAALGTALRDNNAVTAVRRPNAVMVAVCGGVACALIAASWQRPAIRTVAYPVASVRWAEEHGRLTKPNRLLTRDFVGNYLELRSGPRQEVFIDDRFDMFPLEVSKDYFSLVHEEGTAAAILAKWKITTVIWDEDHPLVSQLRALGWRTTYVERRTRTWVVLITPSP